MKTSRVWNGFSFDRDASRATTAARLALELRTALFALLLVFAAGLPAAAMAADRSPPTVGITSPASGAIVAGTITLRASAYDNRGIVGVQFKYNGVNLGAEDRTAPYSVIVDTTTVPNGTYTLTAVARDAAGNRRTSAPVTIMMANGPPPDTVPPAVSISSPAAGAIVTGTIAVTASASDNVGIVGVQFRYNGIDLGPEDTSAPYSINADTTTVPNGSYTLTAIVRDAAGNQATSAPVTIIVSNGATPPPDPSEVTFFCTFALSPTECGFGEQAKSPGRATLMNIARDALTGARLHTEPGDNNIAGSGDAERNDLQLSQSATDCYEGREHWWAHSILFPSDYVDPPMSTDSTWTWGVVFDFHNSSPGGGQANFQINAWPSTALYSDRPTGLGFQIAYGSQSSPVVQRFPIGPVVRNAWYDFVYHVKWSSASDGFFDAWVNGVKLMDYSGPTLYPGQGCYLKLANYHTPFGQPSSVIHDRIIRGTTPAAVSLTPLEGVLP